MAKAGNPIAKSRQANWLSSFSPRPGRVALLWLALFLLTILDLLIFPDEMSGSFTSGFFVTGTSMFSALLAGWILKAQSFTLRLAAAFFSLSIALLILGFAAEFAGFGDNPGIGYGLLAYALVAVTAWIWNGFPTRSIGRRVAAILLVIVANWPAVTLYAMDGSFFYLSYQLRSALDLDAQAASDDLDDRYKPIEFDALWEAQPALIESELASWQEPDPGGHKVFVLSVAASGGQDLFAREAKEAIKVMQTRFGEGSISSGLLSNGQLDLFNRPLATRGNLRAIATEISHQIDPENDVAIIYLASHGGRNAELQSLLPNYSPVQPISAQFLADALAETRIRRRVIIVSSCFAASWIPALANEDTIIIAAASEDRTSFGCDDGRDMTYFGEGFLHGPLAKGASFSESFATAKATIGEWEAEKGYQPSEPQAFIGKNMEEFWRAAGS